MDIYQLSRAHKVEDIINQGFHAAFAFVSLHLLSEPVPISFRANNNADNFENHAVLAIGIDGSDILIYDSNYPEEEQRIINYGDSWDYSGGSYDSSNTTLVFRNNISIDILHDTLDSLAVKLAATIKDDVLIDINQPGTIQDYMTKLIPVDSQLENGNNNITTSQSELYWLDGDTIDIVNNIGSSFKVNMMNSNKAIDMTLPVGATSNMSLAPEHNATFSLQTATATDVEFTYSETYNDQVVDVHVSGVAARKEVTMEETDSGLVVNGLNGLQVTVTDEEEQIIAKTTAGVEDGRPVNIFVEPENNAVSTDFIEEQPELPDAPQGETDNLCPFCHKDHGGTFWGRLVAFFHRIFYFFAHLFGKM